MLTSCVCMGSLSLPCFVFKRDFSLQQFICHHHQDAKRGLQYASCSFSAKYFLGNVCATTKIKHLQKPKEVQLPSSALFVLTNH